MKYLSGVSSAPLRAVCREHNIGLMCQPGNGYTTQIDQFPFWAADNGCFGKYADVFDPEKWFAWLITHKAKASTCLFATAPDVVGNAAATLWRSRPWLSRIRELGYPAAFVAQDGIQWASIPWSEFDVLFIGGSTVFKLGPLARAVAADANARGKAVHMGRVNSRRRLMVAEDFGCTSADGTFLAFGNDVNLPQLLAWLSQPSLGLEPA